MNQWERNVLAAACLTAKPLLAQIRAALVQNRDEPGRQPFTFTTLNTFGSWQVPAGMRYAIETYGMRSSVASPNGGALSDVYLIAGPLESHATRLASDLPDDLGAGLAEIAILSEVAKRQERPRTMELLDGIAGRARGLRESMTDIVWTVDPREDSLADLVLRLRQTAPAVRRRVLLFFKELVTNVARHAAATEVRVEIEAIKGCLRMSIQDNGRGFDPQGPRSGRGLQSNALSRRRGARQRQSGIGGRVGNGNRTNSSPVRINFAGLKL